EVHKMSSISGRNTKRLFAYSIKIGISRKGRGLFNQHFHFLNSLLEFLNIDRLQQIVRDRKAKCFDRKMTMGGYEDDMCISSFYFLKKVKPCTAAHFNVKEY